MPRGRAVGLPDGPEQPERRRVPPALRVPQEGPARPEPGQRPRGPPEQEQPGRREPRVPTARPRRPVPGRAPEPAPPGGPGSVPWPIRATTVPEPEPGGWAEHRAWPEREQPPGGPTCWRRTARAACAPPEAQRSRMPTGRIRQAPGAWSSQLCFRPRALSRARRPGPLPHLSCLGPSQDRRGPSLRLGGTHRWVLIGCSSISDPLPAGRWNLLSGGACSRTAATAPDPAAHCGAGPAGTPYGVRRRRDTSGRGAAMRLDQGGGGADQG